MIVIKTNYTKKLNPIYVESVDASLLYINEISQEQELPIQCKMGKEWTDFEKIYTKEAVLNDSLFLRFMQKSIVRSGSDFCKDFIVVKFRYPAKYMIGEEEFSVSTHNLRKHYYENGVTFLSEKKTGKKKKQEDAESIHYKMLYRSPGKAKKGECIFIRENLFHKAINFLTMGLYDLMEEKAKADPEAVFKLVELSAYLSLSTATAIGYLHIPWEQILVVEDEKVLSIPKIAEVVRTHPVSYYDDEFVLDFDDSRLERILNKHDCTLFDDVANAKGYRLIQNRTKEEVRKNGIRINGKFPGKHIKKEKIFQECTVDVLIRELFNKKIKGKANKYKFNKLIEESKKYNDTVKILASSKRKGRLEDDELYKLKRRQMELFLRKASKNLDQITIIQLVNHALMDSNSDVMGTLLNFLYFNYRE